MRNVTAPIAMLLGLLAVSASIIALPKMMQPPRYQVGQYGPGMVVRLDTWTGAMDLCGYDKVALGAITAPSDLLRLMDAKAPRALTDQLMDLHLDDVRMHNCVAFAG